MGLSRSERKARERSERVSEWIEGAIKDAERASKERSARFWEDYERVNGPGSVDWSR